MDEDSGTAFHGIPFHVTPRCGKYRPLTSSGPKNRTHAKRELERTRQRRRASMDAVCATRPGSDHAKRDATRRYRFVRRARNRSGPVREAMARSRSSSSSKAKKSYCCPTRTAVVGSVCMHHARVRKTNRTNPPSNHEPNGFSARTEPNHGALHHRCIAASATIVDAFLRRGFGRGDDGSLPD